MALGNLLACRVALLVLLCSYRGLVWCIEQPSGSTIGMLPRFQELWALVNVALSNLVFSFGLFSFYAVFVVFFHGFSKCDAN